MLHHVIVITPHGNVAGGFRLFGLPLLVSYPRSGTNWIRYIIEFLSGHPTPGQERLVSGDDYCIDRAHCAYPVMGRYARVVLLLRDYRECILRHHQDLWPSYSSVLALLTDDTVEAPASWYVENLRAYHAFPESKLLLYYEDLLRSPSSTLTQLAAFLGFEPDKVQELLADLDLHFARSVAAYRRGAHTSESTSSRDLQFHARTKLTPPQVLEFDEFYFSRYPDLAHRYLERYRS